MMRMVGYYNYNYLHPPVATTAIGSTVYVHVPSSTPILILLPVLILILILLLTLIHTTCMTVATAVMVLLLQYTGCYYSTAINDPTVCIRALVVDVSLRPVRALLLLLLLLSLFGRPRVHAPCFIDRMHVPSFSSTTIFSLILRILHYHHLPTTIQRREYTIIIVCNKIFMRSYIIGYSYYCSHSIII